MDFPDVAKDTGINRGTITRLHHETAVRVEFEVLEQLCVYLGCDIGGLLELSAEHDKEKVSDN